MIAFLRRFLKREHDPAWKATGYTYRHTGHDESKAVAVFQIQQARADEIRAESAKTLAKLKARAKQRASVTPIRRTR